MSNSELIADKKFHEVIHSYAGWLGASASALGAKDILQNTWKNKKISKGNWVTLVIWGALLFNSAELDKVNAELEKRTTLNTSPSYQP